MSAPETKPAWAITPDQLERGQGIICSTTGLSFYPSCYQLQPAGSHTIAWIYCRLCDAHRRTRADPKFDPLHPQIHGYLVVEAAETAA